MTATAKLAGAVGQLWVFAFVALVGTYVTTWAVGLRTPAILLYVPPLLVWAAWRLRGPRDRLDFAVVVALLVHGVVSLVSRDQLGSLEATGMTLSFALLFWLMREVGSRPAIQGRVAVGVVLALGLWLVAAAVAWLVEKWSWVAAGGGVPNLESAQVFVWGTTNVFPVLALLSVPFLAWLPSGTGRRVLALVIGLASLIVIPLSAGRAGWLGIAVALVVFEALVGWSSSRRVVEVVRRSPVVTVIAGMVVVVVVFLFVAGGGRIGAALAANLESRWRIWEQAVGIFAADPLTGSGPGTFSWVRLEHVPDYVDRVGVVLAHNVPLQTIADGGLLLGVGLALAVIAWAVVAWRGRNSMTLAQRLAVAAVVGLAAASLLDDFSSLPAVTALAVTLAAWSVPVANNDPRARVGPHQRWGLALVAALVGVAVLLPTVWVESSRRSADVARHEAVGGRWVDAANFFEEALTAYPLNPANFLGLGLARAALGDMSGARGAYESVRALSPGDPRPYGALAALADDSDIRIQLLDMASRRSNDPQYAWRLALALEDAGLTPEAAEAFAFAVVLRPDLYGTLRESGAGITRRAVREALAGATHAIRSASTAPEDSVLWDVGLSDGSLPTGAPAAWQAVAAAADGDSMAASGWLTQARRDAPHEQRTHLAAAAVAAFNCDGEAEEAALRLAGGPPPPMRDDLTIGRDPAYREPGIGDYQPPSAPELPKLVRWPLALVAIPECG